MLPCALFLASMLPSWGQEMNTKGMDEFTQKYNEHDYSKAIELGEQVLENLKDFPDLYCVYSNYVIDCYNKVGNKKKAKQLAAKVERMRKNFDSNNKNNQSLPLTTSNNYNSEQQNNSSTFDIDNKFAQLDSHIIYLASEALNDIEKGQYEKAKEKFERIIELHGTSKDEIYGLSLDGLGICSQYLGHFPEAIEYYKESQQIIKDILGENNDYYARSLNNYGFCLTVIGDFKPALEKLLLSLKIREAIFPANHPDIAMSYGNIGFCFQQQGEFRESVGYFEKALSIQRKNYNESHPDVIKTRANLALSYQMIGEKEKTKEQFDLISKYNKNSINTDAAAIEIIRGFGGMMEKDYDEAIKHFNKSIEINKITVGEQHPDIVKSLKNLALCYYAKGDKRYFQTQCDALKMEQELLLSSLGSFNENLRNVYWNRYSSDFLSFYPDLIVSENRKDLAGELYDKSALFAKGLMLSASTEMRRYILDSKDPMAIEQLNELETTRSKIDELKTKGQDTNSLEDKADKIESDLMAFLKEKNIDILQDLRLSWQDVKAKLKDDDIAIEFLTFDDPGVETPYYVALTLRNTYDLPHIIRLGSERDLLKYTKDAYTSLEASAFIWGRFLFNSELEDVNNIYFSPSGELHKIAIESMPYWMDENMTVSDVYNIYRLSSTRELVTKHKKTTQGNGAVLYGHIDYDNAATSKRESEISRKKHETNAMLEDRTRGGFDPEEAGFRGDEKWNELPFTLNEVENVKKILKKNVDMRTGMSATETTFKNLSGEKKKILHIATHGFYWTEEKAQKKNISFSPRLEDDDNNTVDNAMTRSGLLFSGANLTFDHKPIPNEEDDGVLTAQEVSHLDLRGLDLLVLSACQSGQGEISGDGVFGLQRGFKMAGAQSIIMSLWSVNDKATQIMMTEFYKAYTSGKSKREAFLIAQQKVREKYENFEDENKEFFTDKPHWAAFILLDALDK